LIVIGDYFEVHRVIWLESNGVQIKESSNANLIFASENDVYKIQISGRTLFVHSWQNI